MAAESEPEANVDYNNQGLGLADVNETEEVESPYLPPSSTEGLESLDEEEKEKIDLVKATEDLEKERPKKKTAKTSAQDRLITNLQNKLKK